ISPIGLARPENARGTVASVRIPDSITTVGRGRMLTPAAIPMACLIVSTLSNSMTTSTLIPCCLRARSIALRTNRVAHVAPDQLGKAHVELGRGLHQQPGHELVRAAASPVDVDPGVTTEQSI